MSPTQYSCSRNPCSSDVKVFSRAPKKSTKSGPGGPASASHDHEGAYILTRTYMSKLKSVLVGFGPFGRFWAVFRPNLAPSSVQTDQVRKIM